MHITRFPSPAVLGAVTLTMALAAATVEADTIDFVSGSPCVWSPTCGALPFTGATLTLTSNGNFEYKVHNGESGLGVSGTGHTGGEIDVDEFVIGTFSRPTVVESFRVLFLYNGPEYGDPLETAQVSINNGALVATLIPGVTDNTATWSLGGSTVLNCGPTTYTGSGCFDVLSPFGSTLVSAITFTALFSGADPTHNSDFSLASFEVAPIRDVTAPEPATWVLVATGASAALRSRRWRPSSRLTDPAA
jgi:hypothetical protein